MIIHELPPTRFHLLMALTMLINVLNEANSQPITIITLGFLPQMCFMEFRGVCDIIYL